MAISSKKAWPMVLNRTCRTIVYGFFCFMVCGLSPFCHGEDRAIEPTIDFASQIVPLLTKSGCNSGACHGAAAGRGHLHLSLFGSDPANDFESIVHAFEGRRVNLAHPEKSLVLLKPTSQVEHGGDEVFEEGSRESALLLEWIRQGAQWGKVRKLTNFRVDASASQKNGDGSESIRLQAFAEFDGGTSMEVTSWTHFTVDDPLSIAWDETSKSARMLRWGQQTVVARYMNRVVPIQFIRAFETETGSEISSTQMKASDNFIDVEIDRMLNELNLVGTEGASDEVYLRRVYLDLLGRLPSASERNTFLSSTDERKRETLVDRLLGSDGFVDYWTWWESKWLQLHGINNEPQALDAYLTWIRSSIAEDRPRDQFARELLLGRGDSHTVGPANFTRMVGDPRMQAELVGKYFMGARLQCANCHNHPFDRWTQEDYHGLATLFAKLDRGRMVRDLDRGSVTNPRTKETAIAKIPGGREIASSENNVAAFADWLLDRENPIYAEAVVNRIWYALMGKGLVDPMDDFRNTNPASHPKLLSALAADLVEHDYRIKRTMKKIVLSRAYGRQSLPREGMPNDDRFYSQARVRPLSVEVYADAVRDVLGTNGSRRGIHLIDPTVPDESLDAIGRCGRLDNCGGQTTIGSGLSTKLHLLNGDFLNRQILSETSLLKNAFAMHEGTKDRLRHLTQWILVRDPSPLELDFWLSELENLGPADQLAWYEDWVWTLLCSREFRTNR